MQAIITTPLNPLRASVLLILRVSPKARARASLYPFSRLCVSLGVTCIPPASRDG